MVILKILERYNLIQITPKRTKLNHLRKFSRGGGGGMPPNPPLNRAIHPASGMYISPRYYLPMFEHGFTPLPTICAIFPTLSHFLDGRKCSHFLANYN